MHVAVHFADAVPPGIPSLDLYNGHISEKRSTVSPTPMHACVTYGDTDRLAFRLGVALSRGVCQGGKEGLEIRGNGWWIGYCPGLYATSLVSGRLTARLVHRVRSICRCN